jgi:UDP-glucose 6-dehydrogenase
VFVEGLNQRKLQSYREGIETILEGEKAKTIAATTMNAESSRSHVIFTISIQSESQ